MVVHPSPDLSAEKIIELFSSLEGVHTLLSAKSVTLNAWCHYVVFDLWTGIWITENSLKHGVHQIVVIPLLFATMMVCIYLD
jgi:hypothetical protein